MKKYLKFEINGHMFHWLIDFDEDGFFHLHLTAISSDTDCGLVLEVRDILDIDDENLIMKNGDIIPYEVVEL